MMSTHANNAGLRRTFLVLMAVALAVAFVAFSPGCDSKEGAVAKAVKYHCPMHPTVISDKPGDCPICGMKLVPMDQGEPPHQEAHAVKYHCPMHPTILYDKPGDCPICGMKLVPVDPEAGQSAAKGGATSDVPGLTVVSIPPRSRQTMGLKLGTVEKRPMAREVRTSARIVEEETRLGHITLKIEGWVDKLFVNYIGQEVKKGDRLLTIYSPELVTAEREYLTALDARKEAAARGVDAMIRSADDVLTVARGKLEWWDISNEQIKRLEETHQVEKYLTVLAPFDGVVIERNVVAGHKVMAGEMLLTVADLTEVWADADIYQSDLAYVKVGMPLEMTLPYWPGKAFEGKVIFVSPTLDPQTRTLRARLAIPNPKLLLKPGMYGNASLFYKLGEQLSIPTEAAMFSGKHTYAFKDGGDGRLIPTEIRVGARADAWYQLLSGLKEGDRIVVSANFLVDSESSLRAALAAMSGDGSSAPAEGKQAGHAGH